MNLSSLSRLTAKGEGQYLEFKKKANFPEKIVKELVAFANSKGGKLLIGVDDDGTVAGTRNIAGEVFVLEDAIRKYITPTLDYAIDIVKINEKKGVAIFTIPEGLLKPYRSKGDSNTEHGRAFVRWKDESIQASKEMRQILKRRNTEKDERFVYGDKEKVLMQVLEEQPQVTLLEFADKADIPKLVASKTLVKLVLANLLEIQPSPQGDKFFIKTDR